jgi:hypothetical protein
LLHVLATPFARVPTALPAALQAQTSVDSFFDLLAGRTNYTINDISLPLQARHRHLSRVIFSGVLVLCW